jgi:hypothetical protein
MRAMLIILQLDEEFRYLQRKKNVVVELAEVRKVSCDPPQHREFFPANKVNITFISNLTKFKVHRH